MGMFIQCEYALLKVTKNRYVVQRREKCDDGAINAGVLFPATGLPKAMVKAPEVWGMITKKLKWEHAMEVFLVIQESGILESYVKFPDRFLEEVM